MFGGGVRLNIKPMAFWPELRIRASEQATELGMGLRMEVHTAHTEFYADDTVPVGKVAVYVARQYKGLPVYDVTLDSPGQEWDL